MVSAIVSGYTKEIRGFNRADAHSLLRNNLRPSLPDPEMIEYVTGVLISFLDNTKRTDFLTGERILTEVSLDAWNNHPGEAYRRFRNMGNKNPPLGATANLWFAGPKMPCIFGILGLKVLKTTGFQHTKNRPADFLL